MANRVYTDISLDDIVRHYSPGSGRHWFDRSTMRFFRTRLPQGGYSTADKSKTYFVTSEQPPHGPRKYSVRVYVWATRDVDTVGEFCGYASRNGADAAARRHARNGE